jgi:hypothetical protein
MKQYLLILLSVSNKTTDGLTTNDSSSNYTIKGKAGLLTIYDLYEFIKKSYNDYQSKNK